MYLKCICINYLWYTNLHSSEEASAQLTQKYHRFFVAVLWVFFWVLSTSSTAKRAGFLSGMLSETGNHPSLSLLLPLSLVYYYYYQLACRQNTISISHTPTATPSMQIFSLLLLLLLIANCKCDPLCCNLRQAFIIRPVCPGRCNNNNKKKENFTFSSRQHGMEDTLSLTQSESGFWFGWHSQLPWLLLPVTLYLLPSCLLAWLAVARLPDCLVYMPTTFGRVKWTTSSCPACRRQQSLA